MTADVTIEATPGQVAAIERDGFLVVAGPTTECKNGLHAYTEEPVQEYHCPACDRPPYRSKDGDWYCFDPKGESKCRWRGPNPDLRWCCSPVPTTKPCPECGGSGKRRQLSDPTTGEYGSSKLPCPTCNGEGVVPIVVEVVVPEGPCPDHERSFLTNLCTTCGSDSEIGTIPARTLLRGTAEAVPVVDDIAKILAREGAWPRLIAVGASVALFPSWDSEGGFVTDHFADVPRPEVGDTAWIIRGEG